jgi:hypothetical protein
MKIHAMVAVLFLASGQTDKHDKAFHNFANKINLNIYLLINLINLLIKLILCSVVTKS